MGAAVVVLAGAFATVLYRSHFHVWPGQTYPATLHVCGRDFQVEAVESRRHIEAAGYHLIRHGRTPGFIGTSPLWTFDAVDGRRADALARGCHVVMWIQGSPDDFKRYVLEGGP